MTALLSAWRRLDRYILRNHPVAWTLRFRGLHAFTIAASAVLTPVVWLLPQGMLLNHFYVLRGLFMFSALLVAAFLVTKWGAMQTPPLTRGRWPYALLRWYSVIVLSAPILFVSLMIQVRFQLSDEMIQRWGEFLLILLCMTYALQDVPYSVGTILPLFFAAYGLFLGPVYWVSTPALPLGKPFSWFVVAGIAVPFLLSFLYGIASTRQNGRVLTQCRLAILLGLPSLVLWPPALLSSPEERLLHQAILLGCFLPFTPWLQRMHDDFKALPE